jgi:hypothetical protein
MFEFSRVNDAHKPANSCHGPPVEIELDDFPRFCAINLSNAQSLRTVLAHKIIAYPAKFLTGWDAPYVQLPRGISRTEGTTPFPVGPDRHSVGS